MVPSTSGAILGVSIFFPRTLWHADERNRTSNLPITRRLLCPWATATHFWCLVLNQTATISLKELYFESVPPEMHFYYYCLDLSRMKQQRTSHHWFLRRRRQHIDFFNRHWRRKLRDDSMNVTKRWFLKWRRKCFMREGPQLKSSCMHAWFSQVTAPAQLSFVEVWDLCRHRSTVEENRNSLVALQTLQMYI